MKKTVLTYGLIAGAVLAVTMLATLPFHDALGWDRSEVLGYTSMVVAFLLIFFGVRSYRDTVGGGTVGFGRAFAVGTLIAVVASLCYVATWEVVASRIAPDYLVKYQAHMLDEARAGGATEAELAAARVKMADFAKLYANPLVNAAMTFCEPMPVGLVVALVSAGVLSRRRRVVDEDELPDAVPAS